MLKKKVLFTFYFKKASARYSNLFLPFGFAFLFNLLEEETKSGLECFSEASPSAGPSKYPASGVWSWRELCPYLPMLLVPESGKGFFDVPFWSAAELLGLLCSPVPFLIGSLDSDWLWGLVFDWWIDINPSDEFDGKLDWFLSLLERSRRSLYLSGNKHKQNWVLDTCKKQHGFF